MHLWCGNVLRILSIRVLTCLQVGLATIHPLPPSALGDGSYPSFTHGAFVDPVQLQQAKRYLTAIIGPFFADRACRKSTEWAVGLANMLLEKESSLPTSQHGGVQSESELLGMGQTRSRMISGDDVPLDMNIGGADVSMMNDDGGSPSDEVFGAADGLLPVLHSGMGLPLGMGGDLGGLGGDAMDAT